MVLPLMGTVASIDLTGVESVELVRLAGVGLLEQRVSIHLPMELGLFGGVLKALADLGFEFERTVPNPERGATS